MKLKIFIPRNDAQISLPNCISFLYPFFRDFTEAEKIKKYGDWFLKIDIVETPEAADVIVLPYNISYYYVKGHTAFLRNVNDMSVKLGRLIICATKGDFEVTPSFNNFHLYRCGGYKSKNKGNSFVYPVFFEDPANKYYGGSISYHTTKTALPIVGFCGQAASSFFKWGKDITFNLQRRTLKLLGRRPYDNEQLVSTTTVRAALLRRLEKSSMVQTNFIKHRKYRAGANTKEGKEESSTIFFDNIKSSQYIICYRGAGNFSVRLYETMASGRIPVIVMSDNNLPFTDEINWNMFPIVHEHEKKDIAKIISSFHLSLTDSQFLSLQQNARAIWQNYFTYSSFMARWVDKYISIKNATLA